jgi:lipopolysaccharide transport system ATP-binding protein
MSSDELAISIRGVGKQYVIRHNYSAPTTLGEAVGRRLRHPFARAERERFWALRDVTFDLRRGEVLGLIGGNGAGKSTLLKILSRITEMTEGEVDLHGRVGSLLEVGTGFNQELTGRENVFLNGAILGMRTAEIRAQFDTIVEFAGVERFLDTPVKHYSSGMYVRLAFAVAAHLRSEILILDEVLAVGDQEFQSRCVGKMREVATQGRAVIVVSHNMVAISNLCSRAVLLRAGSVAFTGDVDGAVEHYLAREATELVGDVRDRRDRTGTGDVRIASLAFRNRHHSLVRSVRVGESFKVLIEYEARQSLESVVISVQIEGADGSPLATLHSEFRDQRFSIPAGRGVLECQVGGLPLKPDTYAVSVAIGSRLGIHDAIDRATSLEIAPSDVFGTGRLPHRNQGPLIVDYRWDLSPASAAVAPIASRL